MTLNNDQENASISPMIAELDALLNAKETFSERVGLVSLLAGAFTTAIVLVVLDIRWDVFTMVCRAFPKL